MHCRSKQKCLILTVENWIFHENLSLTDYIQTILLQQDSRYLKRKAGCILLCSALVLYLYAESNENCKDTENYNAVSCNVKRAYKNGYEQPDYLNPHNADICENYTQFSVALFIRTSADTAMPDMNTITDNGSTPLSQKLLEADFVWFKRGIIQNEYPATIIRSAIITRLNKFLSLMSRYIFAKAKIIATARSA